MPDINQYTFSNRELLEILVQRAGVTSGRWMLYANFGFSAGNFGPSSDQMNPGAITMINQIGIQRAQPETPVEMTVEAREINKAPRKAKK